MFEVPGSDVKTVNINEDCVRGNAQPEYIRHEADSDAEAQNAAASTEAATATGSDEEENAQVRVKQ